jgi:hypothetical protein
MQARREGSEATAQTSTGAFIERKRSADRLALLVANEGVAAAARQQIARLDTKASKKARLAKLRTTAQDPTAVSS